MKTNLYTNTGNVRSILGLVVTTLLVSYVAQNSTQIVDSGIAIAKKVANKSKKFINDRVTTEFEIWSTLPNGEMYNTGMKTRVSKFQRTRAA